MRDVIYECFCIENKPGEKAQWTSKKKYAYLKSEMKFVMIFICIFSYIEL